MSFTVLPAPDLPHQGATVTDLADIWAQAMADLKEAVVAAGDDGWLAPTPCPGWSVGDILAHATSLERALLHEADPPHQPDWDALPHVTDDFGRLTEIRVDLRRGRPRLDVIAEFDRTMTARREALAHTPHDPRGELENPFGQRVAADVMLRTRIFDTWAHEQDVRTAMASPGHLDSRPAWIAAGRMVNALSYVWAKRVDAPVDSTALVRVMGPGIAFDACTARLPDRKGVLIEPVVAPSTVIELGWPGFVARCCGRVDPEPVADSVTVSGDTALGEAMVRGLAITP